MSKKIMVVSSSLDGRLLTAVETAKELGMKTVACVRREDEPDKAFAHKAYRVNGDETERLLEIAKEEEVDGILGVWDKSSLSASIIARELGLPGNSPECINQLLKKELFRKLQKKAGVFCPEYFETNALDELLEGVSKLQFPIIVKPSLCSSSFGITKIDNKSDENEIIKAFTKAASYSEDGVVCVEEFIAHNSLKVVEADIFLVNDDILWDGLCYCYRFPEAPLRPVLATYPAVLDSNMKKEFESTVRKVLKEANARLGEFNIEGFFTDEGRFFIIEINPRPAGYYCQQDIKAYCGVDYTKLLVTTAVNDMSYYEELKGYKRQRNFILSYAVFSFRAGVFSHVHIDSSIRDSLIEFREFPGGEKGAYIEDIHADNRPVGIAVFSFASEKELDYARDNIRELVYAVLEK